MPVFFQEGGEIWKAFTENMRGKWTGETVDGRKFIRTRRMIEWMRAADPNNGGLLLEHVYEVNRKPSPVFRPVEWEQISDGNYIIMFGFLIDLGYGHLIDIFRQHNIQDNDLCKPASPVKRSMLEEKIQNHADLQAFMENFERRRWEFGPVEFHLGMDLNLNEGQRVLPFCRMQRINDKGATADLYEVTVEEDFITGSLRDVIKGTIYDDEEFGSCYRFALKSYSDDCEDIFNSERNAFHGIRYEKNMIKCLGTVKCAQYRQLSDDPKTPPVLGREIIDFWENLFQIVDALQRVHNLEQKRKDGTTDWYTGCHTDVKPDNILRVQGRFKLADFGYAAFVPCGEGHPSPDGGTETYGAPEFYLKNQRDQEDKTVLIDEKACNITNTIDTWSIACVLSVAVTWVTLGYQGIMQFQTVRQAAIARVKSNPEATIAHRLSDDAFHDGSSVLEDVTNWHYYLRQVMRKSDPVSDRILDIIDNEVLDKDGYYRLTSAMLYEKLNQLLDTAKNLNEQIAKPIIECIVSFDKTAPSTMKEYSDQRQKEAERFSRTDGDQSKHSNKSARLNNIVSARVAHRQVLDRPSQSPPTNRNSYNGWISNHDSPAYTKTIASPTSTQRHELKVLSSLKTSPDISPESTCIYKLYKSLDGDRGPFSNWLGPRRDVYFSNFIEDRDIKFIIDDGTRMKTHWKWVTATLQVLAEKVAPSDDNGVDLMFTFAKDLNLSNVKRPWGKFGKAMSHAGKRISTDPRRPLATDMAKILGEVFQRYERKQSRQRTTLIILTDGVWEGSDQVDDVEEKIARFFKGSKRTKGFEDREFTIQFVSFGDQAIHRLNALDDDMPNRYSISDAIDHEPWTGDPDKMILGSVSAVCDKAGMNSPVQQDVFVTQSRR
ncbi:hypothetical protein FHL15_007930 [Xylaria flabelliformis]|uniref:Protein kinase domain-containing protein n=1 Tax=Xylaria flabelliformis TaxID=2512241 RepID=A0A553HT60_9PEZI|nr:hypothetical protein FHL15_007930 [Xylaria flabelliformis]